MCVCVFVRACVNACVCARVGINFSDTSQVISPKSCDPIFTPLGTQPAVCLGQPAGYCQTHLDRNYIN